MARKHILYFPSRLHMISDSFTPGYALVFAFLKMDPYRAATKMWLRSVAFWPSARLASGF